MTYTGIVENGVVKLPSDWKDGTPVQVETVQDENASKNLAERGPGASVKRKEWLVRLAEMRERMATGEATPNSDQILDDLRSDRD